MKKPSASLPWILLAGLTLGFLLAGRAYHAADKRPPTFDDAWFLETSLHFYHRLTEHGVLDFAAAYAGSFRTKAPLISALPLPFYMALGTRPQSAILVNFVFLIVANVFLFLLVRRILGATAALGSVLFFQTMPLTYGIARVFMPDYGLTALVIVWIYLLLASEGLTRGRVNLALGVVFGLGLLMKVLFPLYVAGPFLVTVLYRWKSKPEPDSGFWSRYPFLGIALPAILLAATWYPFHLRTIFGYAWQAGYGSIGEQYGNASFADWLFLVVNHGISFYYVAAVVLLGAAALAFQRLRVPWDEKTWLLLSWFAIPAAALAAGRNQEIRLILPVLPPVAIALAAALITPAWSSTVRAVLLVLVALFPLRLYAALTFPPPDRGPYQPLTLGRFVVFTRETVWAHAPDARGRWRQEHLLEALQRLGPPSLRRRYVVIGAEHSYFNANLFQYLNAYKQYPFNFNSLGYAETSVDRAVERIYSLDARYIVMPEGFHSQELAPAFNHVNAGVQALLDRGELPFRLRAKVPLNFQIKAAIYERETPWIRYAPGELPPVISHPLPVEFAGGLRFLGYDWIRKNRYLWEFSTWWTAPRGVQEDYRVNLELERDGALLLSQDHFLTNREHPPYDWPPGEVVRQSMTLYLPGDKPVNARLWLAPWGIGDPAQILKPAEMVHTGQIDLRLK